MKKLCLVPVVLAIACLFAGLYGMIHNQVSYTVSPEYFTQFKFHQFDIADGTPHRLGAAIVGWKAAWWMGVIIGGVLLPIGLFVRDPSDFLWSMIRTFGVVTITAFTVGVIALLCAYMTIDPDTAVDVTRYGNEIEDDAAFMTAGTMHNFSYLGGFIGILTGAIVLRRNCQRSRMMPGTKRQED